MVFAGVGLVALPLDLIRSFLGRPTATIPKSEYIKRARGLGQRAIAIKARRHKVRFYEFRMQYGRMGPRTTRHGHYGGMSLCLHALVHGVPPAHLLSTWFPNLFACVNARPAHLTRLQSPLSCRACLMPSR